jgi:hypothetical protein
MEEANKKITAKDILSLLRQKYLDSREWVVASEVQRKTGWSDRRYDFVAMNCFESTGQKIEVVEIKVSKSDLRHELEEAEKHTIIFDEIDYYSLAAPAEVIDMRIIPPKWGVYACQDGKLITKRKPLHLHDEFKTTMSRTFAASFLRAAIAQNMEKTLLYDEKKKAFEEGFKKGRETCGFAANEREEYERLRKENNRIFDVLYPLGMASIISAGEMGKKKVEAIKKALSIVENLDVDYFAFCVDSLKQKVGDLEKSMVELKALQEQAAGGT